MKNKLSYKKILNKFQNFEIENDLTNFKHNNIDLWPLIKYQTATKCFDLIDTRHKKLESLAVRVFDKLKLFISFESFSLFFKYIFDFQLTQIPKGKKFLYLSDENSKRIKVKDHWIDIFIEPYLEQNELPFSDVFALRTNQSSLKIKQGNLEEKIIQFPMIFSFIKSQLFGKKNPDNSFKLIFNKFEKFISEEFQGINAPKIKDIIHEANFIYEVSKYLEPIILNSEVNKIILTHYLSYQGAAMCYIAKKNNIEILDIQHGVQGSLHPAYNYRNLPKKSFNTIPNSFVVYSERDKKNIDRWSNSKLKPTVKTIKNGLNYLFSKKEISEYLNGQYAQFFKKYKDKKLILITLCWAYYFPKIFQDVLKNAKSDIFFLIKFHPNTTDQEKKEVLKILKNLNTTNYEIHESSNIPLFTLFSQVNIHLAIVSTAILEALDFNLFTIATGSRAEAYYGHLASSGDNLIIANSQHEILDIINKL